MKRATKDESILDALDCDRGGVLPDDGGRANRDLPSLACDSVRDSGGKMLGEACQCRRTAVDVSDAETQREPSY